MAEIVRQESVATVGFDSIEQGHVDEELFRKGLDQGKTHGTEVCGSSRCELEGRLGKVTVTFACRRVGCVNPLAPIAAASRAASNIGYLYRKDRSQDS
jgi:hypothetical protein